MTATKKAPGSIVVFVVRKDAQCDECGRELGRGGLIRVVEGKAAGAQQPPRASIRMPSASP